MTIINKQKFLAELGRLLTFMYEEDRQLALSMYEQMFDSCNDAHGLMQVLVSPTRQAVTIARAYDANDRKLQVHSSSREDEGVESDEDVPAFVMAIDAIYETLSEKYLLEEEHSGPVVLENQISFFDEDASFEEEEPQVEVEEEPAAVEELQEEEAPVAVEEEPAAEEQPCEEVSESEAADAVDAFLAAFSIDESQLIPTEQEEESEEEELPQQEEEVLEEVETEEEVIESEQLELEAPVEADSSPKETTRKPRVFLMILYTIFAIPATVAGVALLLIPTVLVLALACVVILAGSAICAAAFGSFAVFSDLLVVLGSALVVLAVGLILLWLFIWLIGGAIFGLIKAIVRLGSRCCYKEVAAEW